MKKNIEKMDDSEFKEFLKSLIIENLRRTEPKKFMDLLEEVKLPHYYWPSETESQEIKWKIQKIMKKLKDHAILYFYQQGLLS